MIGLLNPRVVLPYIAHYGAICREATCPYARNVTRWRTFYGQTTNGMIIEAAPVWAMSLEMQGVVYDDAKRAENTAKQELRLERNLTDIQIFQLFSTPFHLRNGGE